MSKKGIKGLGRVVGQLVQQAERQQRVAQMAQDLTDDGFPPGHPLRTLCLLVSGPEGAAQHAVETTSELLSARRSAEPAPPASRRRPRRSRGQRRAR